MGANDSSEGVYYKMEEESLSELYGGFPKMVGFPNSHGFFPAKNDQHLGCEMGGTTI